MLGYLLIGFFLLCAFPIISELLGYAVGLLFLIATLIGVGIFLYFFGLEILVTVSLILTSFSLVCMPLVLQGVYIEYVKKAFKEKDRTKFKKIKMMRALFIFLRFLIASLILVFCALPFLLLVVMLTYFLFQSTSISMTDGQVTLISGALFVLICLILVIKYKKNLSRRIMKGVNIKRFNVSTATYDNA